MHIYPKHTGPVSPDVASSAQSVDAADRIAVGGVVPTPSSTNRSEKV
jgi:hypothetical protein